LFKLKVEKEKLTQDLTSTWKTGAKELGKLTKGSEHPLESMATGVVSDILRGKYLATCVSSSDRLVDQR